MRHTWSWFAVAALVLVLAGCGPQGSGISIGTGTTLEPSVEVGSISALFAAWEAALEAYDVAAMMAPIALDFHLSISENGLPQPEKDYDTLRDELEANEANQLRMRAQDGYTIEISFGLVVTVNGNGTARAVGVFDTVESITGVAGTFLHESGVIDVHLSKVGSQWLMRTMTLNFNPS